MNFLETLLKSPSLSFFKEAIRAEPSLLIEELWESPLALLAFIALRATEKNLLIITESDREEKLAQDLLLFGITPLQFPALEILTGEEIVPCPDIMGKRLETLERLLSSGPHIVLTSLQALLQKLPSPHLYQTQLMRLKKGEEIPFARLIEALEKLNYRKCPIVTDKGEFAIRGGIIDLFPISHPDPIRLEFFGDQIEEIRLFDPVGQKSIRKIEEFLLTPATASALGASNASSLFDYLGENALLLFDNLLALEDRYVALKTALVSPVFFNFEQLFEMAKPYPKLYTSKERIEELSSVEMQSPVGRGFYSGKKPLQPIAFEIMDLKISAKRWAHPFRAASDFFSPLENRAAATKEELLQGIGRFAASSLELHFFCATDGEEKTLKEWIRSADLPLPKSTHFEQGYLSSGICIEDSQVVLFPMTELTHRYRIRRQKWRSSMHTPPSEFHELSPGDIVVHFHQGIAKYLGIEKRPDHLGQEVEFLRLEFAEKSILYLPVSQSYLISRYIGSKEELPTLNALGSAKWQRTKAKAQQAIYGYAEHLLRKAAQRELSGGFSFPEDTSDMEAFEREFPFVETDDQLRAIEEIKKDMCSKKAMDRLICGDVGYGKTEVAMRAAFKAVLEGATQVAVLVPTTVLAMQHYETFCERMANFPITIKAISRFHSPKEVKQTLEEVAKGSVDILIGTHRLLSKDIHFKNLGLVIIDEEQRFGVRAKEAIKAFKAGVDCLTLSATPIPRTLYLSLIGAREISTISTPPQDRLPIKTILCERDPSHIQNALLRELSRDGQAFFIHNRVESIYKVADELRQLLPQARILACHGQLSADEIDAIFHAFKEGSADILVTTTIVENGIDVPNANTILIDRADTFGLADLYQLRGRVGRWHRPAYAYFLVPAKRELPELSSKRLKALLDTSGYGGGMKIAMRDLEIRGAGDILGTQQSGQVGSIGFHLYCKLLKKTIDALRKKVAVHFTETKMEFSFNASIPEEYIPDISLRMEIYHRLGEAESFESVELIKEEMRDRFGSLPPSVLWLCHLTRLKIFASGESISLLKFNTYTFTVERLKAKKLEKKVFPLPKTKKPDLFEKEIINLLTN